MGASVYKRSAYFIENNIKRLDENKDIQTPTPKQNNNTQVYIKKIK